MNIGFLKRTLCFCFLTLIFILIFLYRQRSTQNLLSVPKRIELPVLYSGETRTFEYEVQNTSSAELTLISITPTCSCIVLKAFGPSIWRPGENRSIHGTINFGTEKKFAQSAITISVRENSGKTVTATTIITGEVDAPIILSRPLNDFGSVDCKAAIQTVSFNLADAHSHWKWDKIIAVSSSKALESRIDEIAQRSYTLNVVLNPSLVPISSFHETVDLYFTYRGIKLPHIIKIPIIAKITGPFVISPNCLFIKTVGDSNLDDQITTLKVEGPNAANLLIEDKPNFVTIRIVPVSPDTAHIKVSYLHPPHGLFSEHIILVDPATRIRLSISVFGFISRET